jgi:hypothetical protein
MHETGRGIAGAGSSRVSVALCTGLGLLLLVALACVPAGRSQTSSQNVGPQGSMHPFYPDPRVPVDTSGDYDAASTERRLRAINVERQKQMVADANKLLKLAKELKDDVASSKSDSFTPDQLHKIAEIEKLARSVKERMAEGVGPAQQAPPFLPTPLTVPIH